jgi:hypothetical protein
MRLRRSIRLSLGILVIVVTASGTAQAQYRRFGYPGGYGGYGWGGWGADPASGYMAGLGSYAQGEGQYEVADAKAQSINADTIIKWNKALEAQKRANLAEQQKAQALQDAQQAARGREAAIVNGSTLNALLNRILEFNPSGIKAASARAELSPAVIRDIPFETATEAITVCIDQMTVDDAWPPTLQDDRFAADRSAIRKAAKKALEEDAKGDVKPETVKDLNDAVSKLRAKYTKSNGDFDLIYADSDDFVKSLAGLSRMLTNPRLKPILAQLEEYKKGSVGDLIAFMQAFNLRFGPATSDRQTDIYHQLVPLFEQVATDSSGASNAAASRTPDSPGNPLPAAARQVFRGMSWKQMNVPAPPAPR